MFKKAYRDVSVVVTSARPQCDAHCLLVDGEWKNVVVGGSGALSDCEDIADAIRRHVDLAHVRVAYRTVQVCEFCDNEWDEAYGRSDDVFFCCGQAADEWLAGRGYEPRSGQGGAE